MSKTIRISREWKEGDLELTVSRNGAATGGVFVTPISVYWWPRGCERQPLRAGSLLDACRRGVSADTRADTHESSPVAED